MIKYLWYITIEHTLEKFIFLITTHDIIAIYFKRETLLQYIYIYIYI